jgi:hypothetical protein
MTASKIALLDNRCHFLHCLLLLIGVDTKQIFIISGINVYNLRQHKLIDFTKRTFIVPEAHTMILEAPLGLPALAVTQ